MAVLERELAAANTKYQALGKDVAALNAELSKKKLEAIPTPTKDEWKTKSKQVGGGKASFEAGEEQLEFFALHGVKVTAPQVRW
jgi:Skp family chaperone for outer membrane proteins